MMGRLHPKVCGLFRMYAAAGRGERSLPLSSEIHAVTGGGEGLLSWYDEIDNGIETCRARHIYRRSFGYCLPSRQMIEAILPYGPFVDCGAGTGFLSRLLANAGADIIAFDQEKSSHVPKVGVWFPVKQCGSLGRMYIRERTPILAWPNYQDSFAAEVAAMVKPGRPLIYIGEGDGGCTGDDSFHDLLESAFDEERYVMIPRWYGLRDGLFIYRRRTIVIETEHEARAG